MNRSQAVTRAQGRQTTVEAWARDMGSPALLWSHRAVSPIRQLGQPRPLAARPRNSGSPALQGPAEP